MSNAECVKRWQQKQKQRLEDAEAEVKALAHWRDLALQFDRQRMTALGHLKSLVRCSDKELLVAAEKFLKAPPLAAHEVTAKLDATRHALRQLFDLVTLDEYPAGWTSKLECEILEALDD